MTPIPLPDLERIARALLPGDVWDYITGGGGDEITLRDNTLAFDRLRLRPRVLVGAHAPELRTSALGTPLDFPVMVAPVGYQRQVHPEGELAVARAVQVAGVAMVTATMSTSPMEEIAAAGGGQWFQLYVFRDMGLNRALIERAEACGARALVITVDAPRLGLRLRDARNQFALAPTLRAVHLPPDQGEELLRSTPGASSLALHARAHFDDALDWRRVEQLQGWTRLPLVIKGVMTGEDADRAMAAGAAGVVVSNHGGRQLDGVLATVDALPEVVEAVAGRGEVYLDGGIRRGTDVLKALALGARAVMIGRPMLWGLAAGGQAGVERVLAGLRAELELAMVLSGRRSVGEVDAALIHRPRG